MQTDSHCRSGHATSDCPSRESGPIPRVILADDQKEILRTVALILSDDFSVVGTAENGMDAVDLTTKFAPDVLVLDVCMPVENGIEAACHLRDLGSATKLIFLTINRDPDFVN